MPHPPRVLSAALRRRTSNRAAAMGRHYLPDLVYGANDGVITTFAVVCGVVGANLSARIILILGCANLIADGVSMGASNFLARRSFADEAQRAGRRVAVRHGSATTVGFVVVGTVPLLAYLFPLPDASRFGVAVVATLATLFAVGALRSLVTKAGWVRSGAEMLAVGASAAVFAYAIGAAAAAVTST